MGLLGLLGQQVLAVEVPSLFSESVAVESQDAQQRQAAAKQALATVLVRVSGTDEVLRNADVRAALSRADRYLAQFSYQSNEEDTYELQMEFAPQPVTNLLKQSGQPVWSGNRPAILSCVQVISGANRLLVTTATAPWNEFVLEEARRRGLAVRLPGSATRNCDSNRAGELVLNGDLRISGNGCAGQWSLPVEGRDRQWKFSANSDQACVGKGMDAMAETLSASYAFAGASGESEPLILQVAGVDDFTDYTDVVVMLKDLAIVEAVDVAGIDGNTVNFSLQVQGDAAKLEKSIRLKGLLQQVDAPPQREPTVVPASAPGAALDPLALPEPAPLVQAQPQVRLYYRLQPR
jgi:hypothetical protein